MVTLEAMELVKEMNKNMNHFGLAMSSYMYPNRYKFNLHQKFHLK